MEMGYKRKDKEEIVITEQKTQKGRIQKQNIVRGLWREEVARVR